MSEPTIGEIRMFAGNFPPRNWAFCNGQILPVNQFEALFSLLGTIYGGDGRTTFALPELRGRIPVHYGSGPGLSPQPIGNKAGAECKILAEENIPKHSHQFMASTAVADSPDPQARVFASASPNTANFYDTSSSPVQKLAPTAIAEAGGNNAGKSTAYDIRMPSLAVSFIIAMNGIYPSRN